MNKAECISDKYSTRAIGLVLLVLGLVLAAVCALIMPVVGVFFAVPLLGLSAILLAAPQSKACRMLTGKLSH